MSVMDGAAAIWIRNLDAFKRALEGGWRLPRVTMKTAGAEDISLVLRVVTSGWLEGWKVWLEKEPRLARIQDVIDSAISHAQPAILEEILRVNGGQLPWNVKDNPELQPVHRLFGLIGSLMGKLEPPEQILATVDVLRRAGMDVMAPYPGEAVSVYDLPGHTLWSMAVLHHHWDLVQGLGIGDEAFEMPKGMLAMNHWFKKAWMPLDWAASDMERSTGIPFGRESWLEWMSQGDRFARWAEASSIPTNIEFIDGLTALDDRYQKQVWEIWASRGPAGPLADLVSSILDLERIEQILATIRTSLGEDVFKKAWEAADEFGVSPAFLWESKKSMTQ